MKNGKVSSNVPEKSNLSPNLHPASSDWGQAFLYLYSSLLLPRTLANASHTVIPWSARLNQER